MANGGIIPPDGRPPAPKGVGRTARRHDLERPKTPGLAGSDLQYGDVERLRGAQRIAPTGSTAKQVQQPAAPQRSARAGRTQTGGGEFSVPDPISFLLSKLGGTLQGGPAQRNIRAIDPSPFIPLLRSLANSPGSSGTLQNAVINQLSTLISRPYVPEIYTADLQDMDDGVEEMVNVLEERGIGGTRRPRSRSGPSPVPIPTGTEYTQSPGDDLERRRTNRPAPVQIQGGQEWPPPDQGGSSRTRA